MYRNIELILYDRDEIARIISICNDYNFNFAYAFHDKDIKDDNSGLKKAHYHFDIFYKDQKSLSSWSKILNIPKNMIEIIDDKKRKIRYLIHIDNKNKYQYDYEIIQSNFDIRPYFIDKSSESDDILLIISFIDNNSYIKYRDLFNFILSKGLWSTFRRNYTIIKDLLFEHNLHFNV